MKRFISAGLLATGLWLGVAAPAGAIIVIGGSTALGGPDTRVAVDGSIEPCIAGGGFLPCVGEGRIELVLATKEGRS